MTILAIPVEPDNHQLDNQITR